MASAAIASDSDELPGKNLALGDQTVVVRGNRGATLRSIADDGRTLTLDAKAEGADRLAVGKVMVLTGVTAVKVAKVERSGDSLVVTASPAAITDVVKDGTISWNGVTARPATLHLYAPDGGDFVDQGASTGGTKAPRSVRPSAIAQPISMPLANIAGGILRSSRSIGSTLGGFDVDLSYEAGDDGSTVKVTANRGAGAGCLHHGPYRRGEDEASPPPVRSG